MLNAIKNNKVDKRIFKKNEDSLTSSIFERLNYLPKELFKNIIQESINDNLPNIDFNTINEIVYWPHWSGENTKNENFVEPDIFIRFDEYDMIIEAKRYDENQQYSSQWINEIQAYLNEYGKEEKSLIFIALGGINNNLSEIVKVNENDFKIYKCKWSDILKNIKFLKTKIEYSSDILNANFGINNILLDIITVFQLYGFSVADWFDVFQYESGLFDKSIRTLISKKQFYE